MPRKKTLRIPMPTLPVVDDRIQFTKGMLRAALDSMTDVPDEMPVFINDCEFQEVPLMTVAVSSHPYRKDKILLLETD